MNNNQVRFIVNGGTAQQVFGTPFGNTPRNPVQDDISNIVNMSLSKRIKLSERTSFEFRTSFLNSSIIPTTPASILSWKMQAALPERRSLALAIPRSPTPFRAISTSRYRPAGELSLVA